MNLQQAANLLNKPIVQEKLGLEQAFEFTIILGNEIRPFAKANGKDADLVKIYPYFKQGRHGSFAKDDGAHRNRIGLGSFTGMIGLIQMGKDNGWRKLGEMPREEAMKTYISILCECIAAPVYKPIQEKELSMLVESNKPDVGALISAMDELECIIDDVSLGATSPASAEEKQEQEQEPEVTQTKKAKFRLF